MASKPKPRDLFYEVLTAAINDLLEHGFDSQMRVDAWVQKLETAARSVLVPEATLHRSLKDMLLKTYERTVESDKLIERHQGISEFTLASIKPKLRAELDRRILASANLIKLNREASIQRTLQRFQGWATSIPIGGTDVAERAEAKDAVRRGIAGLPFEERRVVIDQGHKLVQSINEIVATDGGAIAAIWHSHFRESGYDYRPEHKKLDGEVLVVRNNWALQKGLMKLAGHKYTDQVTAPGEEIYCFPGDSRIQFANCVDVAYRRWYCGELAQLVTANGETIRATPNHPVLTPHGFAPIGSLNEGDDLLQVRDEGVDIPASEAYADDAVPSIAQIFDALRNAGNSVRAHSLRGQFHGDGMPNGHVDVVRSTRPLSFGRERFLAQSGEKLSLSEAYQTIARVGTLDQLFKRGFASAPRIMGSFRSLAMLFASLLRGDQFVRGLLVPRLATGLANVSDYHEAAYAVLLSKGQDAFTDFVRATQLRAVEEYAPLLRDLGTDVDSAGLNSAPKSSDTESKNVRDLRNGFPFRTEAVKVVKVERLRYAGHVYNLQTKDGWYLCGNIPAHNCRCYYEYVYNLRDLPPEMLTAKGKEQLERVKQRIAGWSDDRRFHA